MQFFCGSWIPSYLLSFLYWENILWNAFEYFFCNVLAYMAPTTKTTYVLLSKSYLLFLQWTSISITILVFVSKWASFHDTAKCSWLSCTFVQIISTSWCTIIWMQDYVIDLRICKRLCYSLSCKYGVCLWLKSWRHQRFSSNRILAKTFWIGQVILFCHLVPMRP